MAIRHLLLAALASSAFSAHAGPGSADAAAGTGTLWLSTMTTNQVQSFMPPAIEEFFIWSPGSMLLADSSLSIGTAADAALLAGGSGANAGAGTNVGTTVGIAAAGPTALAVDANAVPEPATNALMLAGLAGVGLMARRRRSR